MKGLLMAVHMQRRAQVACLRGFSLWSLYSEKEAGRLIGWSVDTLARRRRNGALPDGVKPDDSIKYPGYMIADIILFEIDKNAAESD